MPLLTGIGAPSADPTFFRETYEKKNGGKNWSPSKKSEKFALTLAGKGWTAFIKAD